jgi:hypothetical protein
MFLSMKNKNDFLELKRTCFLIDIINYLRQIQNYVTVNTYEMCKNIKSYWPNCSLNTEYETKLDYS